MFELTLIDHLRLTFGHVVYRHKTHSQLAHERARRSRWLKAIEAALMAGVVGTATAAAFGKGPITQHLPPCSRRLPSRRCW